MSRAGHFVRSGHVWNAILGMRQQIMKLFTLICLLLCLTPGITPGAVIFEDHFNDAQIGPEWALSGVATETGSLIKMAGGNYINSFNTYEGDFHFGLRNIYDSRSIGDYGTYTIGYIGYNFTDGSWLLFRNDNQGGGLFAVQVFVNSQWTNLATYSTADYGYHNIDGSFEWTEQGLRIRIDDLGKTGIEIDTLITNTNLIPHGAATIYSNANTTLNATWDTDYVRVEAVLPQMYTVSGTITADGQPLEGVILNGLPGNPATNGSGFYTASVEESFSGTVMPYKEGYTFDPESRNYNGVNQDYAGQDYTAAEDIFTWGFWPYDMNEDGIVNVPDFASFGLLWLGETFNEDLVAFSNQWLKCSDPRDSACSRPAYFNGTLLYLPGDVEIELLLSGSAFGGIGRVSVRGTQVRSGQTPWTVSISDKSVLDSGTHSYTQTLLDSVDIHKDGLGADVAVTLVKGGGDTDSLIWTFRAVQDEWDGLDSSGFSYRYHFSSAARRVHKLIEHNSFALNGSVNGSVFASQRELYLRPGSVALTMDNSTQLAPWSYVAPRIWPESRIASEDAMDFLDDGSKTFVRFLSEMALVYKNMYRYPGEAEITCKDWYMTELTYDFTTVPMEVRLYDRTGPNAWIQARDYLSECLYASADLTGYEQDPKPTAAFTSLGVLPYPPNNHTLVNWAVDRGLSRVWVWSRWDSDWNRAAGGGLSHALWYLDWDEVHYELYSLNEFANLANAQGIETVMWIPGGHLSLLSPLWTSNPSWITRKPDGQTFTYVYTDLGGNHYNAGFGDYLIDALGQRVQEMPFKGIWLDSFQVFGAESINYGDPLWKPNLGGATDFVKRARQELGLTVMAETGFPLALASSTAEYQVNDPTYGIKGKEWVGYKLNKYHCYQQTDPTRGNYDPIDSTTYFRLMAYKSAVILLQGEWPSISNAAYVNKAYANALPYMKKCHHLDNGNGVVWYSEDESTAVVWSFTSGPVELGRTIVTAVDAYNNVGVAFSGSQVTPGNLKTAIVTF